MFTITAPVKDFTGKRGDVAFIDGVAKTDDTQMLAYFKRHGYTVEGGSEQARKDAGPAFPEGEPSEDWKANELKAYAVAKDIDLGAAKTKPEMVEVIATAISAANAS